MRRGQIVAEIYYNDGTSHHTDLNVVCDARGKHLAELVSKDDCITFCENEFGKNLIFVDRYNHNILVINESEAQS